MIIEKKKGQSLLSKDFIESLIKGDVVAVSNLFEGGNIEFDDPYAGSVKGKIAEEAIKAWEPVQNSKVKSIALDHFTIADGCSGAEITLNLEKNKNIIDLHLVVVSDLSDNDKWLRSRIYYRRALLDGIQHVRERMLNPRTFKPLHPTLIEYQRCLREADVENMIKTFSENGYLDGHGQSTDLSLGIGMGYFEGTKGLRDVFTQLASFEQSEGDDYLAGAAKGEYLEHVNAFFDGTTTILEFNIVRPNDPKIPVQAGVACYEMNTEGLLIAARIYDEGF